MHQISSGGGADSSRRIVAFGHLGLLPQMINPRQNPDRLSWAVLLKHKA